MPVPPPLRIPWIDRSRCVRKLDCDAARECKEKAIKVQEESVEEPGFSVDCPVIDLEMCKQCGDCERACPEKAIKMI